VDRRAEEDTAFALASRALLILLVHHRGTSRWSCPRSFTRRGGALRSRPVIVHHWAVRPELWLNPTDSGMPTYPGTGLGGRTARPGRPPTSNIPTRDGPSSNLCRYGTRWPDSPPIRPAESRKMGSFRLVRMLEGVAPGRYFPLSSGGLRPTGSGVASRWGHGRPGRGPAKGSATASPTRGRRRANPRKEKRG
jgi:hypothetical protein